MFDHAPIYEALAPSILAEIASRMSGSSRDKPMTETPGYGSENSPLTVCGESLMSAKIDSPEYEAEPIFDQSRLEGD